MNQNYVSRATLITHRLFRFGTLSSCWFCSKFKWFSVVFDVNSTGSFKVGARFHINLLLYSRIPNSLTDSDGKPRNLWPVWNWQNRMFVIAWFCLHADGGSVVSGSILYFLRRGIYQGWAGIKRSANWHPSRFIFVPMHYARCLLVGLVTALVHGKCWRSTFWCGLSSRLWRDLRPVLSCCWSFGWDLDWVRQAPIPQVPISSASGCL